MALTQKEWNGFVLKYAPGALFQSWDWGEVEKKLGKKVWRLSWAKGIAQVVKISARRGTFLHIRHGPIGDINFDDIINLAKQEGAWFIRISPQEKFEIQGLVPAPIHAMDAEVCWVLDLDKSEEELLRGMRKSTRYEIKHTSATVTQSTDIQKFLDLYTKTSERHAFVEHKGIREEFATIDCDLFLASQNNQLLAAAIIVYYGNQAIYHHGASIPNNVGASYALQWEAILHAKKRGMKHYNFWGIAPSDDPNHPWAGLSSFKKGFGGREMRYMHAQDYLVSALAVVPRTIENLRKRLKGY